MNREDIKKLLPHREPMLLIDEAEQAGDEAVASYTIKSDDWFVQGHFPGNPVVPGVILCEMMGQSACVLINLHGGKFTPYFTGLEHVKFRHPVKVGDTVVVKSKIDKIKRMFYFVKSSGYVNGNLCVSGDLSFALVEGV